MKNMIKRITFCVLVLIVVACNSPAPTASPTPTPNTDAVNKSDEQVLVFRQSGGLAGVNDQWVLYADGRIKTSTGQNLQVSPEAVAQLLDEIEKLGFYELESRYVPLNTCCDRFTYEVTIRNGGREHSITVLEATPDVPESVWTILNKVSAFLSQ
jgi:hypothetical protein